MAFGYEYSKNYSNKVSDCLTIKKMQQLDVQVIAAFRSDGKVKPLRIRVCENEEYYEYNVAKINYMEEKTYCGYRQRIFDVCIEGFHTEAPVQLILSYENLTWKMVF